MCSDCSASGYAVEVYTSDVDVREVRFDSYHDASKVADLINSMQGQTVAYVYYYSKAEGDE